MRTWFSLVRVVGLVAVVSGSLAAAADGQTIGPVSWQLQPYCNVVTVSVTAVGSTFRLEGVDDQCGAVTQASVIGTAFVNPNGTLGLGLNVVATPGGPPVHIDATVSTPGFSGFWRDSIGGAGTFTFGAGGLGGAARPLSATGTSVLNVVAGPGLVGGGSASTVNVGANFAGPGAAATVAHSDHTHAAPGTANTAVGASALGFNVSGTGNTAIGHEALAANPAANGNTAVGYRALFAINQPSGGSNVAIGGETLYNTTGGHANVAVGTQALRQNSSGHSNSAFGATALLNNTSGFGNVAIGRNALSAISGLAHRNIGIGYEAGIEVTGGSDNIIIGNEGAAADTLTIKIGTDQTRTFIAGVNGGVLDGMTDVPVNVDAFNKLGTTVSSARFKTDIADLRAEESLVQRLRPVSFRYLPVETRGARRQYGLIAEEVAELMPELVVNDADGKPYTVRYQLLPPLLLAEVQRLERERNAQDERIAEQARELAALRALVDALVRSQR